MVVIWPVMVKIWSAIGDVRLVMGDVCSAIGDLKLIMGDEWPVIGVLMPAIFYKIYFFVYFELFLF